MELAKLTPFGALNDQHKTLLTGLYTPMYEWAGSSEDYRKLLSQWLDAVAENIWPHWTGKKWVGAANKEKEVQSLTELEIAVELYHGIGNNQDILLTSPNVPPSPDGQDRNQLWHYRVEDAYKSDQKYKYLELAEGDSPSVDFTASNLLGANYFLYEPGVDVGQFNTMFWGRMRGLQPALFDIKNYFQRPRPYSVATAFGVDGFRWTTASGYVHTGVHPSILSGHCIQGILGGCSVFEALLEKSKATGQGLNYGQIQAIQKYMVDWGDRRVFAGVHYMTDNIASWTLARELIPNLFRNPEQVLNFAVQALTRYSLVYRDIHLHFDQKSKSFRMLKSFYPEEPFDLSSK